MRPDAAPGPGYGEAVSLPFPLATDGDAPRLLVVVLAFDVGCDDSTDWTLDDVDGGTLDQFPVETPPFHGAEFALNVFPGVFPR